MINGHQLGNLSLYQLFDDSIQVHDAQHFCFVCVVQVIINVVCPQIISFISKLPIVMFCSVYSNGRTV